MSSILRSSKFVRYFFGLARSIIISNRQEIDGGLLHRSHHLTGLFSNNFSSSLLRLQSGSSLEQTVRQLDEDARRTGRVSITEVEEALNNIKNTRNASASQSLMVIRCCGNLVPEETPEQRTKLVDEIWKTFEKIGVPLDVSHYNALLKVYLENEHKFSPTEFLARLEANGIEPNRVTYQRLVAGFCQQGDIAGATTILEFMKEKQLPVSEGVFNALILGHSKANDMESAEAILNVMRQANLEPSNVTYTTLLSGYAARGDTEAIQRLLTECKVKDILLSDRDFLEIGYTAAVNGHDELLEEILKNIRRSMGYNQDAANVFIRLITVGKDEAAYKVFLSLNPTLRSDTSPNMSGHLFIKHLVKDNRTFDQILSWCERLQKDGHTSKGLWIAVDASFHHHNTHLTMDLLRTLKQRNEPIRVHYFWPSLATAGKTSDFDRMTEIIKQMMDEFEMTANSETLKDYFLPFVSNSKSTSEILDSLDNIGVKKGQAIVAVVSHLISKNKVKEAAELACQHSFLNYRSNLSTRQLVDTLGYTQDVPSVVDLLHVLTSTRASATTEDKDEEEESVGGEEVVSRFLENVVGFTPTRRCLADVLKEMLGHGIPISSACAVVIEKKLQGKELTSEISELLAKLSSGEVVPQPIRRTASTTPFVKTPASLMRIKERLVASNEPVEKLISINRALYQVYCREGDVENALRIKQELEEEYKQEATTGMWAGLLDAYCMKNDLEGAKNCLEKIKTSSVEIEIDAQKILKLAQLYIENNQIDEAESLLKSVKPREKEEGGFVIRNQVWLLLQATCDTYKDPERVKKMLNLLVEQKYAEVSNPLLGFIMKAHLIRDDLEGALKEFEGCVKLHRATPYKNELTMKFIEKEDATNLQTVVDLSTEVHGEVNSLYDLVLSFIECGKMRQARKILETPGLTNRSNRLLLACERYKKDGKVNCLEALVEVTKDVAFIDRSEMYNSLLDTYCQADEVEKALGLWTKMQDEDVSFTDEFLIKLGQFLKEKGHQVPFEIPTSARATIESAREKRTEAAVQVQVQSSLLAAISRKNVDEALKIKDKLESSGMQMSKKETNRLLELLVEQSRLRDATALLTSVTQEQMPNVRTLNYLFTRLLAKGEIDLMHRIDQHLPEDLKKMTSFSNRMVGAAVIAGRAKEELDKIEKEIDAASSDEEIDHVTNKFPRGGIMSVLESSPTDYEQVARIVDKFQSKGSSSPANCLTMYHLAQGDGEKARQLFQKYNLNNSSQLMFRNVLKKARMDQNPKLLEELLTLLEGAPAATPEVKGLIYSSLINVYSDQGNYDTALQKLDEAVKTVSLEKLHSSSLVTLKNGLEASNKTFNYTIPPPRKQKESSSSSSSSESEPKKSVASN